MTMNRNLYSTIDCVRLLGIAEHRLLYAHRTGKLAEPDRIANKRIYDEEDLKRVADYFNVPLPEEVADA
jgi:DNA-binding transcriptional MerR regulator